MSAGAALFVLREYGLAGAGAFGRLQVLRYLEGMPHGRATEEQLLKAQSNARLFKRRRLQREIEVLRRAELVTVPVPETVYLTEKGKRVLKEVGES